LATETYKGAGPGQLPIGGARAIASRPRADRTSRVVSDMRAEISHLADEIEQGIVLLRRHL
jgi:hypothetical protein